MAFMELEITRKGALYTADCSRCGSTVATHEFASWNVNEERDMMRKGTLACPFCAIGKVDKETFKDHGRKWYAGRYSAPGYLDCTDWIYETNLRRLEKELKEMYGEKSDS